MKKYFILLLSLVLTMASSCSSEYDLANVDKNICIGGEDFVFPLGVSSKMVPDSILNISNIKNLYKDETGTYFFNYTGSRSQKISFLSLAAKMSISRQVYSLNPVKGTLPILSESRIGKLSYPYIFTLGIADSYSFSYDFSGAEQEGLHRLDSLEFSPSVIKVSAGVECAGVASLPELDLTSELSLPSRFNINDSRVKGDTLVAAASMTSSGKIDYDPVRFTRACFADSYPDLKCTDILNFHTVKVTIPDATAYKAIMGREITVSYVVSLEDETGGVIVPEVAWCLVSRQLKPISDILDITGIPDYMRNGNLDLTNPLLTINLTTNATLPVRENVKMASFSEETFIDSTSASMFSDFVKTPYQEVTSNYVLANEDAGTSGYEYVKSDICALVKKIPQTLNITFTPSLCYDVSDASARQVIFLTEDMNLKLDFDFTLPLSFGPLLNTEMRDTIINMPEALGDVLLKRDMFIIGDAYSTLPMDMVLKLNFLDKRGSPLDISSSETVIKGVSASGAPSVTSYSVEVKKSTEADKISKLEIILTLKDGQSVNLNEDDYVQLSLQASVPGGIEIEIDND